MVRVMEASASVLRNLNREIGGVERVERITEGLRKEMDKVEDVNTVIGEVGGVVIDEGEVDDELEELEMVEREKKKKEETEDKRKEAEAKEDKRRAEETKNRFAELEDLEKKRQEAEKEIGSKKSSEDQEVGESTEKMGRMSLEDGRPGIKSQSDNDQLQKEEVPVLTT
jgi:charged multivesicular body protein 7